MDVMEKLPEWVRTNKFYKAALKPGTQSFDPDYDDHRTEAGPEQANLISSHAFTSVDGVTYHYPMIDLDLNAALIPSSTEGHFHLYLNRTISHDKYRKMLEAMVEAGIVQKGILGQFDKYGSTTLRLPHIKKEY
jgi:hypothetical protein